MGLYNKENEEDKRQEEINKKKENRKENEKEEVFIPLESLSPGIYTNEN